MKFNEVKTPVMPSHDRESTIKSIPRADDALPDDFFPCKENK